MTKLEEIAIEYEKLNPEKARAAQTQLAELTQILSQSLAKNADQELTIARLTAANKSMQEDAVQNTYAFGLMLKANKEQAAEIARLTVGGEMKIRPLYETEYTRIQEIEPFPDHPNTTITVSQRQAQLNDEWKQTEINWPGCGTQNSSNALMFAAALKFAADLARTWDTERGK